MGPANVVAKGKQDRLFLRLSFQIWPALARFGQPWPGLGTRLGPRVGPELVQTWSKLGNGSGRWQVPARACRDASPRLIAYAPLRPPLQGIAPRANRSARGGNFAGQPTAARSTCLRLDKPGGSDSPPFRLRLVTPPPPAPLSGRCPRPWFGACRAAACRRSGAPGAWSGGCPT